MDSFDASGYEGATYTVDLNTALSGEFAERYTVVIDSGSLEHVLNLPIAVKHCMEMFCVGGHYLCILPGNNFFGHRATRGGEADLRRRTSAKRLRLSMG